MESRRSEVCRDYDPDKYDGFGRDNCHRELSARYPIDAIVEGGARLPDNLGGTSSNMPAFGEILTDEEISAVLAYIKRSWPEDTVGAFKG
jgi:mono/diheme cytochrome c family protein